MKKNKIYTLVAAVVTLSISCTFDYGEPKQVQNTGNATVVPVTVPANKVFTHPGLLHTESDFSRMKTNVEAGNQPWLSGWQKLIDNSHSSANYTMQGPVVNLIRGGNSTEVPLPDNYSTAFNDAAGAYQNAIVWKVTGNAANANKAIQILNAWAATCTSIIGNSNKALGAGLYGYQFANAAEIMRGYSGWAAADFNTFKQWMRNVWYPVSKDFIDTHYNTCISHYWANWDLCNIASIMSIAVLTDDVPMYTFAIDYLMTGNGNGQLLKTINHIHAKSGNDDIDLGQIQESGRDQGHALLCMGLMGTIAQMAGNQGEDIWGYNDNMILKGAEYLAKYNYARLDVPFTSYTNCANVTHATVANDASRGNIRPIWERIRSHYVTKQRKAARYTVMAADMHSAEGGGGDYGPNSGGFDDLGFGTLLYTQ
ncbi:cell wall anchor protein [Flavobacterium sp. Sd200]|uniref:alginate lyase family protein n=1 Tax=Flavobacterium sp. Sd200 TaxID=2692211 RepID=UPI001367F5BA|nr:alginate lyase family protein [Flavobacterium sp. Sd200]MXN90767.1 cell wall anchor protein [Flavobacterium sp. Sd200]